MINVWNKYGEPKSYGNGETDLITIIDIVNIISTANRKAFSDFGQRQDKNE